MSKLRECRVCTSMVSTEEAWGRPPGKADPSLCDVCEHYHSEDMEDQFEDMYYTVQCNTCGEKISRVLLSRDFSPSGLQLSDMGDSIIAHNMTHYVSPNNAKAK